MCIISWVISETLSERSDPMAEKFTTDFAQRLHAQVLDRPKGKQRGGDIVHADHIEQGKSLILRKSYGGRMTWKVLFYVTVKDERSKAKIVARAKKLGRYPDMSVKQAYTAARNFNHHRASAAASSDTFGKI